MGRLRLISFKLPEELLYRLDRYCARYGITRSTALRYAISLLLSDKGYHHMMACPRCGGVMILNGVTVIGGEHKSYTYRCLVCGYNVDVRFSPVHVY